MRGALSFLIIFILSSVAQAHFETDSGVALQADEVSGYHTETNQNAKTCTYASYNTKEGTRMFMVSASNEYNNAIGLSFTYEVSLDEWRNKNSFNFKHKEGKLHTSATFIFKAHQIARVKITVMSQGWGARRMKNLDCRFIYK